MIVDASVVAKLFSAEVLSQEARELVGQIEEVWAPAHCLAEVAEVLCRKAALGEVSDDQCLPAVDAAARLLRSHALDDLIVPATRLSRELGISAYDSLYLALADRRDEALVTWDKRLLRAVQGTRFERVVLPLDASWRP